MNSTGEHLTGSWVTAIRITRKGMIFWPKCSFMSRLKNIMSPSRSGGRQQYVQEYKLYWQRNVLNNRPDLTLENKLSTRTILTRGNSLNL